MQTSPAQQPFGSGSQLNKDLIDIEIKKTEIQRELHTDPEVYEVKKEDVPK
jgi:hypothetical protein